MVAGSSALTGARPGVRKALARVDRAVVAVETAAAAGLVFAVLLTVLVQVVMRYVFARPNPWTEELSRYLFIWLSLLGASLASKRGAHFVFDTATTALPPAVRVVVLRTVTVLVAAMLAGAILIGVALASQARLERSPALDLPWSTSTRRCPSRRPFDAASLVAGRTARTRKGNPVGVALIAVFVLLVVAAVPIAFALGGTAALALIVENREPLLIMPQQIMSGMDSLSDAGRAVVHPGRLHHGRQRNCPPSGHVRAIRWWAGFPAGLVRSSC